MAEAEKINGEWIEKTPSQFRKERNASIPDARLVDEGLHDVAVDPEPDAPGQIVEPGPIVDRDGLPVRTWVTRDPTAKEVDTMRAKAHAEWVAWLDQFLNAFLEGYPRAEPLAWTKKEAAAEAYDDGVATQRQITALTKRQITALTNEAEAKSVTVADLAASIIAHAEPFNRIIEFTSGLRSRTQAQINTADIDDVQGIVDAAKAEATAKAQEIAGA